MSVIDKFIGAISPKAAFQRAQYRAAAENLRAYDAAQKGRRTKSWKTSNSSANSETKLSVGELRNRARDLVRNNPYAKKAIDVLTTNTIGSGIHPTPNVDASGKIGAKNAKIAWKQWSKSLDCDKNRQMNMLGMERLAFRTFAEAGGCIIRRHKRRSMGDKVAPLALQILEPDYIDLNRNWTGEDGSRVVQGVEFDAKGNLRGYWMYENHPGDYFNYSGFVSKLVPAEDIIYLYKVDRPGQVHGVPMGVSAFIRLRDLDAYADAQLVRQQIAACWVGFISDSTESFGSGEKYEGPQRAEPGMFEVLPPGKQITFGNPPGTDGYEPYTRSVLREIAAAYGITYEALTGDLSNVNFSSARMGWLEFGRIVEELQEVVFIPQFMDRVWSWFNEAAIVGGFLKKEVTCDWTAPRRAMIDPVKETKGLVDMVRAGFISWQEAVKQLGYNPEDNIREFAEDYDQFDENGFMFESDPRFDDIRGQQFAVPGDEGASVAPAATSKKKARRMSYEEDDQGFSK